MACGVLGAWDLAPYFGNDVLSNVIFLHSKIWVNINDNLRDSFDNSFEKIIFYDNIILYM